MDQKFNAYRLKLEASEAAISNLKGEKEHLELSLAENKKLKERYFKKSEEVQAKYQEIHKALNEVQKDKVAIDEIKIDRDQRIERLRTELNGVNGELEEL